MFKVITQPAQRLRKVASLCVAMMLAVWTMPYVFAQAQNPNTITIATIEDWNAFTQLCRLDSASENLTVRLVADLDFAGEETAIVPYFSGTFEGQGFALHNVSITASGSAVGVFRYVGEAAQIKNLTVSGSLAPSGSATQVGALAGVNFGSIINCKSLAAVKGKREVGGVVGYQAPGAVLQESTSSGTVLGRTATGGVVGRNEGEIVAAKHTGKVNIKPVENSTALEDLTLDIIRAMEELDTHSDTGGIAGYSSGTIAHSTNSGTVGYAHVGYNVGGIVGRQVGIVTHCTNNGTILGRKDVGGICGQAEPYIALEETQNTLQAASQEMSDLRTMLANIPSTLSSTAATVGTHTANINNQFSATVTNANAHMQEIRNTINSVGGDVQAQSGAVQTALAQARVLMQQWAQDPTQENAEVMLTQMNVLLTQAETSLAQVNQSVSNAQSAIHAQAGALGTVLAEGGQAIAGEAGTLTQALQSSTAEIAGSLQSANNQAGKITDTLMDGIQILTQDSDYIEDISDTNLRDNQPGTLSHCTNSGIVQADVNVGGIVGLVSLELDLNPEEDLDFSQTALNVRRTAQAVVRVCVNEAAVTGKKNGVGGIVGKADLGLILGCENYGPIVSTGGKLVGGVVGESLSVVRSSYAFCVIEGGGSVGGIAGEGTDLANCIAMVTIQSTGEKLGAIAGMCNGTAVKNFFVSDTLGGFDGISYEGAAMAQSYAELIQLDALPERFTALEVQFKADGEIVATYTLAYGESLKELPSLPQNADGYGTWPQQAGQNIVFHTVVEAEYTRWIKTLAAFCEADNEKPFALIEGQFYTETALIASSLYETISLPAQDATAWKFTLENAPAQQQETTLRLHAAAFPEKPRLWQLDASGAWQPLAYTQSGSYLVCTLPQSGVIAVAASAANLRGLLLAASVLFGVCLVLCFLRRRKRVKSASNA